MKPCNRSKRRFHDVLITIQADVLLVQSDSRQPRTPTPRSALHAYTPRCTTSLPVGLGSPKLHYQCHTEHVRMAEVNEMITAGGLLVGRRLDTGMLLLRARTLHLDGREVKKSIL